MGAHPTRDFASLLDDLITVSDAEDEGASKPSIPFDYLSVVEELHSGRIKVSTDAVAAEYRETAAEIVVEELFAAIEPVEPELPVEPDAIRKELALDGAKGAAEFARIRRTFAFSNHPDRVPDHMRERAIQRMQVANMLIDEARQGVLKRSKR